MIPFSFFLVARHFSVEIIVNPSHPDSESGCLQAPAHSRSSRPPFFFPPKPPSFSLIGSICLFPVLLFPPHALLFSYLFPLLSELATSFGMRPLIGFPDGADFQPLCGALLDSPQCPAEGLPLFPGPHLFVYSDSILVDLSRRSLFFLMTP